MTQHTLPAEPRASSISSAVAVLGLMLVMATLAAGITLSTDALDARESARTTAWLFPVAIAGIGALLTGVILRFRSILTSLGLRMDAMRAELPVLINTNQKAN